MSGQKQTNFRQSNNQAGMHTDASQLKTLRELVMGLIERSTGKRQIILAYTLLIDFFERDHNAAILLNQILYWTTRTNDPEGWFYKTYDQWYEELRFSPYQVWRVVRGDSRVQKYKRTLWSIGLETDVRMAPNGRNAVYYRLNIPAFMTAFTEWLQQEYGLTLDGTPQTPHPPTQRKSRLSPFRRHQQHFGKPTPSQRRAIWKQQHILGEKQTLNLLQQCIGIAKNWDEVYQLLMQEAFQLSPKYTPPNQTAQHGFERISDNDLPRQSANITPRIQKDWQNACHILKFHIKTDYDRLFSEHRLVDHHLSQDTKVEIFTIAIPSQSRADELNNRWLRFLRRYVSDAIGRDVDLNFIDYQKWRQKPLE
jgi:hypothetical protein